MARMSLPEKFARVLVRVRPADPKRRAVFEIFAHGCRQRGLNETMLSGTRSLARGLAACPPRSLTSWEDFETLKMEVRGKLTRSDEELFIWALGIAVDQLIHNGKIAPRIRHRSGNLHLLNSRAYSRQPDGP